MAGLDRAAAKADPKPIVKTNILCTAIVAVTYGVVVFACTYLAQDAMPGSAGSESQRKSSAQIRQKQDCQRLPWDSPAFRGKKISRSAARNRPCRHRG